MLVKSGEGKMQVLARVGQTMSQSRKNLVVMKVAMLGRSSCRPEGDTGQKVSLVQKLGWGPVMVSISISLGSYCSRRLMSLVAISCLSSVDSLAGVSTMPFGEKSSRRRLRKKNCTAPYKKFYHQ